MLKSVVVPVALPWSTTEANGNASFVVASTTFPKITHPEAGRPCDNAPLAQKKAQNAKIVA